MPYTIKYLERTDIFGGHFEHAIEDSPVDSLVAGGSSQGTVIHKVII